MPFERIHFFTNYVFGSFARKTVFYEIQLHILYVKMYNWTLLGIHSQLGY